MANVLRAAQAARFSTETNTVAAVHLIVTGTLAINYASRNAGRAITGTATNARKTLGHARIISSITIATLRPDVSGTVTAQISV